MDKMKKFVDSLDLEEFQVVRNLLRWFLHKSLTKTKM